MSTEVKVLSTSTRTNLKLPEVKQAVLDFYEAEEIKNDLANMRKEALKMLAEKKNDND